MTKIAIIYDSGYGHTEVVANEVASGVRAVSGVSCSVYKAAEAGAALDKLSGYDALILGSPTYMGGVTAAFKGFMDASGAVWMKQGWKDKFAAGFTNSGGLSGDKLLTLQHMAVFAAQHSMLWISQGLMPSSTPGSKHGATPEDTNRLGSYLGLMTQSDNSAPAENPSAGDKKTAQLFGKRVAEVVARYTK